jgi:hypothetical protein
MASIISTDSLARDFAATDPRGNKRLKEENKAIIESTKSAAEPNWNDVEVQSISEMYQSNLPTSLDDLKTFREPNRVATRLQIKISPFAFSCGDHRAAYKALILLGETWSPYVVKRFLDPTLNVKSLHLEQLDNNACAKFLAEHWMTTTKLGRDVGKIKQGISYVEAKAFRVGDHWYGLERVVPGTFEKWTDNQGFCETKYRGLLEFAKWTKDITDGFMMVADIQGGKDSNGFTLTDPAMQCEDGNRFGKTNIGTPGISICYDGAVHALENRSSLVRGPATTTFDKVSPSRINDIRTVLSRMRREKDEREAKAKKKSDLVPLVWMGGGGSGGMTGTSSSSVSSSKVSAGSCKYCSGGTYYYDDHTRCTKTCNKCGDIAFFFN